MKTSIETGFLNVPLKIQCCSLKNQLECYRLQCKLRPQLPAAVAFQPANIFLKIHVSSQLNCFPGTRLQTSSQLELPNRKVELLTLENAHHCFKSVMYCVNTGVNSPLVLLKLFDKCDYFMERSRLPTDKDYRECLETMFPLTQYNIPIIRDNAFRCLQCIGW